MQSRATGIADHVLPLGDLFFSRVNATLFNQLHVYPSIRFFLLPYDLSVTSYNSMILSGIFSCFFFLPKKHASATARIFATALHTAPPRWWSCLSHWAFSSSRSAVKVTLTLRRGSSALNQKISIYLLVSFYQWLRIVLQKLVCATWCFHELFMPTWNEDIFKAITSLKLKIII